MWYTFCAKPMILIDRIVTLRCRSPCGERGLKSIKQPDFPAESRSPCGERGLKCGHPIGENSSCFLSLPVRGAWIEINQEALPLEYKSRSLPVRGAWIEILRRGVNDVSDSRRSPCGERGLKCAVCTCWRTACPSLPVRGAWIEIASRCANGHFHAAVAPRAGSVD